MNWLARLKKIETAPELDATEPTKPGFVGFVAPAMALLQKTGGDSLAANDSAQTLKPVSKAAVSGVDSAGTVVCKQLVRSEVRTEKPVSSGKVSTLVSMETAAMPDPDRWAWPHSTAMTGWEVDAFTARLARFTDKGLGLDAAESLADKLVTRDREADDRRLCLECVHLAGHAAGAWGCKNWHRAGVAIKARDAQLSAALVYQPQRCNGFKEVTP